MFFKHLAQGTVIVALALATACNGVAGENATPATTAAPPKVSAEVTLDDSTPVATLRGETITLAQVDEAAASSLFEARQAMYEARMQALDQLINDRLIDEEAKRRSMDQEAMFRQEIEAKATPPTDAEIEAFFNANRAMMRGEFEELKPRIAQHLHQQKLAEAAMGFIDGLRTAAGVKVMLEPPRIPVNGGDSPRWGKAGAPVEIVEFSDFQCPYCTRGAATLDQVKEHYGDKVTIVYRHFPLPMHDRADEGAAASECANEQGKFWEYHDQLFANQRAMSDQDLRTYAQNVGLDMKKFDECYQSGRHEKTVQQDIEDGAKIGMSGTPGFYINGRMLAGAQPFEAFKQIIDDELERKGQL